MSDNIETIDSAGGGKAKRPGLMTVGLILTYIFNGVFTLIFIAFMFFVDMFAGVMQSAIAGGAAQARQFDEETTQAVQEAAADAASAGTGMAFAVLAIFLIFFILNIVGASMMWKMKRSGFWIYTVPNVLVLLLVGYITMQISSAVSMMAESDGFGAAAAAEAAGSMLNYFYMYIGASILFIGLYASNLKKMA